MTPREIGKQLVDFCKNGKNLEAINALYGDGVESVEAGETPGYARVTRGKAAVIAKNVKWGEAHEIHRADVAGPYPHGDDKFAVRFAYDITHRPSGQRMQFDEIAVFTVANARIVKEEFFYDVG